MPTRKKPAAKKVAPAKKAAKPGNRAKAGTSKEAAEARKRRFVEAFLSNGENATEAAATAGYSPHTARQQGARLLSDVSVQDLIRARRATLVRTYELNTGMVLRSIVQELTFDPARLYDQHGQLKPVHELDEDTRMVLTSLEAEQHGSLEAPVFVRKVKWAQRQGARDHAMKYLGMFEADNKQRLLEGLNRETLKEIAERLRG